jgi:hypothetical protein
MGNAFGGWLNGHMLDWFGYVPNVEQSERALTGILLASPEVQLWLRFWSLSACSSIASGVAGKPGRNLLRRRACCKQ